MIWGETEILIELKDIQEVLSYWRHIPEGVTLPEVRHTVAVYGTYRRCIRWEIILSVFRRPVGDQ